jgi:serine/threonine-protein kinase
MFLCRTPEGDDVRVLDFGSVKLQLDMGAKLTAIGTTVGSPFYMSPEQAMGRADVDQRTDVFALGAILYEMLTDKIAFDAPNLAKILMRIMHDSPAPPSTVNPSCPPTLDSVVAKALSKTKTERYGSARELAQATLAAYGLSGSIEEWATRPEADTTRAIESAPRPAVVPVVEERVSVSQPTERGDATLPKMRLSRDQSTAPALVGGMNPGAMALIALSVVVAAGLLLLLLR